MFELTRVLLSPALRGWAALKDRRVLVVPRPTDLPHVHAGGPASDSVLLVGSGPAVGWGVLSHELALPGALGRALSARSGRGADVDVVANPAMTISTVAAALGTVKLWRYDAIVVTVGINDSTRLVSPRRWEEQLRTLLATIHSQTSRGARVFIVGIQPLRSIELYDDVFGSIAAGHADALNEISARVCDADAGATFIPLPAAPVETTRYRGKEAYKSWGTAIADGMVLPMDGASAGTDADRGAFLAEAERQHAVDELRIVDTAPEARYDRIVSMARQLFGTESAAFSISDRDRQWYKSRVGIDAEEIDRDQSFCAPTLERRGPLIVADALKDEQFRANPFVVGDPHVRFYAGFPIHSRSGEPIGVLCVFDPKPRPEADVDVALLHRLALQVQREVQGAEGS